MNATIYHHQKSDMLINEYSPHSMCY